MAGFKSVQANSAIIGIYSLLMTVFVLAALYFGQDIIIPLSLAILLTFLLSPIVTKMESLIYRCDYIYNCMCHGRCFKPRIYGSHSSITQL
jgi:predicted PurR-regulated permease PerM